MLTHEFNFHYNYYSRLAQVLAGVFKVHISKPAAGPLNSPFLLDNHFRAEDTDDGDGHKT